MPYVHAVHVGLKTHTSLEFIFAGRGAPHDLSKPASWSPISAEVIYRSLIFAFEAGILQLKPQKDRADEDDLGYVAEGIARQYEEVLAIAARLQAERRMPGSAAISLAMDVVFRDRKWRLREGTSIGTSIGDSSDGTS